MPNKRKELRSKSIKSIRKELSDAEKQKKENERLLEEEERKNKAVQDSLNLMRYLESLHIIELRYIYYLITFRSDETLSHDALVRYAFTKMSANAGLKDYIIGKDCEVAYDFRLFYNVINPVQIVRVTSKDILLWCIDQAKLLPPSKAFGVCEIIQIFNYIAKREREMHANKPDHKFRFQKVEHYDPATGYILHHIANYDLRDVIGDLFDFNDRRANLALLSRMIQCSVVFAPVDELNQRVKSDPNDTNKMTPADFMLLVNSIKRYEMPFDPDDNALVSVVC